MFYRYQDGTRAVAVRDYEAPYPDPLAVGARALLQVDEARSHETDIMGWLWCRAEDGREGWAPEGWLDGDGPTRRIVRDFDARELTVRKGDRLTLLFAESGFVLCRNARGDQGWLPDAVLAMERPG